MAQRSRGASRQKKEREGEERSTNACEKLDSLVKQTQASKKDKHDTNKTSNGPGLYADAPISLMQCKERKRARLRELMNEESRSKKRKKKKKHHVFSCCRLYARGEKREHAICT